MQWSTRALQGFYCTCIGNNDHNNKQILHQLKQAVYDCQTNCALKSWWNGSDRSFLPQRSSATDTKKRKSRAGSWFYALDADWLLRCGCGMQEVEEGLNLKGRGFSKRNDWINPAYVNKEKTVVPLDRRSSNEILSKHHEVKENYI